jgi:hypothetical protein
MSASWRLLLDQTVASPPRATASSALGDESASWSQYQAIAELTTIVSRVHQTLARSDTASGGGVGSMAGYKFEIALAFTRDDLLVWRTKHAKQLGEFSATFAPCPRLCLIFESTQSRKK